VRCNSEDDKAVAHKPNEAKAHKPRKAYEPYKKKDDWRSLMNAPRVDFKGEEPDFSEEGWARRKPKKKK
jgi:ATP-dependent RNA helicase DeaD